MVIVAMIGMGCEFPSSESEAFQSTGRRAHPPSYIAQMRNFCLPPLFRGEMLAAARSGKNYDSSLFREVVEIFASLATQKEF